MKQCKECLEMMDDSIEKCPNCGSVVEIDKNSEENIDMESNNSHDDIDSSFVVTSQTTAGDSSSEERMDWKRLVIDFLKATIDSFKDFIELLLHPDAEIRLSKRSLILFVIIEILATFSLMSTFGKSVYLYFFKPIIVLSGLSHLWVHQFQMSAIIPFVASVALVCISGLIYTFTLIIGRQRASFTQVVSHLLTPSLALMFAAITLKWMLPINVYFIYLAIGFILLWLISTLMHVVDDLKINNFYLRIVVLSVVAIILIAVIGLCFQLMITSLIQFPSNMMNPGYFI